jgi:hypothetical protein
MAVEDIQRTERGSGARIVVRLRSTPSSLTGSPYLEK